METELSDGARSVLAAALALDRGTREILAQRLIQSVDTTSIETPSAEEIAMLRRRLEEVKKGGEFAIPAEEAMRMAKERRRA